MAVVVVVQVGVGVPSFVNSRKDSRLQTIISNLKLIEAAKEECWANVPLPYEGPLLCTRNGLTDPDEGYMDAWPSGPVTGEYVENHKRTNPTFRGKDINAWKADPSGL
jgi:hypothetical protein